MGRIFDYNESMMLDEMHQKYQNCLGYKLEQDFIRTNFNPVYRDTALVIGCGTGHCLPVLTERGLQLTGTDPSTYMIDICKKYLHNKISLKKCHPEQLPFDDNSFNNSFLFSTLEFSENPEKVLEEAFRVTKDKVYIGVHNKFSIYSAKNSVSKFFTTTPYTGSNLFSIWDIKKIIKKHLGQVPVTWRTIQHFPEFTERFLSRLENMGMLHMTPFGSYICMIVIPYPTYRTTPLKLKLKSHQSPAAFSGFVTSKNAQRKVS